MACDLYKNDTYSTHQIPYIFNRQIIEYDMKDAGFSISKEYGLLTQDEINKYESYKKQTRTIELGKKQSKDKAYTENLKKGFILARQAFFLANDLEVSDVIAIKKDAIFVAKEGGCKHTKFGKYIDFREKHAYTSYIKLPKRMEIYYSPSNTDIKGINDTKLQLHNEYMVKCIKTFCHKMETSTQPNVISYMRRFGDKYKKFELPVGYYREFNANSKYKDKDGTSFDEYWDDKACELDITYNYFNIIIKLLEIVI